MYINIPNYQTRFLTTPLVNAVGFISISNFDHLAGSGRIVLSIYADRASADANLQPLESRSYPVPATDPHPDGPFSLPALSKIEADNLAVFTALVGVFYGLLLADPALAGATILPETTPS